jgi:hypothetical protein
MMNFNFQKLKRKSLFLKKLFFNQAINFKKQ